ncbi:MAG: hypothetical protein ACOC93_05350 [Planctomycetota bacterium]
MSKRSLLFVGLALAIAAGPVIAQEWDIPSPDQAEHPGAEAAPASSPTTYPDPEGFERRSQIIMKGLADNDLAKWRRGYFAGGDPGKYLPGPAMAKLVLDPDASEPRKYMNDDRSWKEHYHFAAVNWGRFYPLFSDALTEETRQKVSQQASRYRAYWDGGGTENHKIMWFTTSLVLPHYLPGETFAQKPDDWVIQNRKNWLRDYVKGLYEAGQGEWDSSTYLMFDVNGMLNIYDFSPDPETRLLAKAALDWYLSGYALKYNAGVYTAPNQRGYPDGAVKKIADQTGWLWWDAEGVDLQPEDTRNFLYTMHAITSSYRPNQVIHNIAKKNLPMLPVEQRNSKPNYWGGTSTPKPNAYQESFYITPEYTMGSLWNGHGGQMTRFQVVARTDAGGVPLTGGHPRASDHRGNKTGIKFHDGIGRYDQTAQVGPTQITMSKVPEGEEVRWSFFSLPERVDRLVNTGDWWIIRVDETFLGLQGLGESSEVADSPLSQEDIERGRGTAKILKFHAGENGYTGFVLETADTGRFDSADAFARALNENAQLNDSQSAQAGKLEYTSVTGQQIAVQYQPDQSHAEVSIDGEQVSFADWPVYGGPIVTCEDGVLSVTDGEDGFVVDFSGEMPIYKPYEK